MGLRRFIQGRKDKALGLVGITTIFLALFLSSTSISFSAVAYEPGCEVGQYVQLEVQVEGEEKIPSSPISTVRIEVTAIEEDNVTCSVTETFQDDTENEYDNLTIVEEVVAPSVNELSFVIAGGLEEGDAISPTASEEITGSKTKRFEELDGSIEAVYYEGDRNGDFSNYNVFWDKDTGLLVGYTHLEVEYNEEIVYTTKAIPIDTNLEVTASMRPYLLIGLGIGISVAIIIGAFIFIQRR